MTCLTCSLTGMTVTVTNERCFRKSFLKIFPIVRASLWSCRMEHRNTHQRWLWSGWMIAFSRNWSRWSQNSLAPTFTRYYPLAFLSLGLYERWNQEKKIHATIIQMKEQVKEIIVSISVEILRCIIGKLNRRIQTIL